MGYSMQVKVKFKFSNICTRQTAFWALVGCGRQNPGHVHAWRLCAFWCGGPAWRLHWFHCLLGLVCCGGQSPKGRSKQCMTGFFLFPCTTACNTLGVVCSYDMKVPFLIVEFSLQLAYT